MCSFPGEECYPGKCITNDAGRQCTCTKRFTGKNCRIIKPEAKPEILQHNLRICSSNDATGQCVHVEAADGNYYIGRSHRVVANPKATLEVMWMHTWKAIDGNEVYNKGTELSYIDDHKFGIASAAVGLREFPTVLPTLDWNGLAAPSSNNPHLATKLLKATYSLKNVNPRDGTIITTNVAIRNGGYVTVRNKRVPLTNGQLAVTRAVRKAIFDFTPPFASGNMLNRKTPEMTQNAKVVVQAQNWQDATSGLGKMIFEACPMNPVGADLDYNPGSRLCITIIKNAKMPSDDVTFGLPGEGLWTLLLQAFDKANNVKAARRLVLYHKDPSIKVGPVKKTLVLSAGNQGKPFKSGDALWATSNTQLKATWVGVFSDLATGKWLGKIRDHGVGSLEHVERSYDEPITSAIRREGTPNLRGITKFMWSVTSATAGAATLPSGGGYTDTKLLEDVTLTTKLPEGHVLKFKVQAHNIYKRTAIDEVDFLVDTTPPDVKIIGLSRDGKDGLQLHGLADMTGIQFKFNAGDVQSGLQKLEWEVKEDVDLDGKPCVVCQPTKNTISLGQSCKKGDRGCICTAWGFCRFESFSIPANKHQELKNGLHGRGYTFTIIATNKAGLKTRSKGYRITIDTSPPVPGIVHDGASIQTDVDFQAPRALTGVWAGFNDPETGVRYYKYKFGMSQDFKVDPKWSETKDNTITSAKFTADKDGKWYLCVAALNNANAASDVRCSDGVFVDGTKPAAPVVRLAGAAQAQTGIAKDSAKDASGKANVVYELFADFTRQKLRSPDASCTANAPVVDMSMYTIAPGSSRWQGTCSAKAADKFKAQFFQASNRIVTINWDCATPYEQLREFQVGLSAVSGSQPTLRKFERVGLVNNTLVLHSSLGQKFYAQVKAIKHTGAEIVGELGPIFVDSSPPVAGDIKVSVNDKGLKITWSAFVDKEPEATLKYQIGLASTADKKENVAAYAKLQDPLSLCGATSDCATVPHDTYGGKTQVYALVRACNPAGLCTVASSAQPTPNEVEPGAGRVYEVASATEKLLVDVAYQSAINTICVMVDEFVGGNLKYQFAVGTTKGGADVVPYGNWQSTPSRKAFCLSPSGILKIGTTYYTTVRARNSAGVVEAHSNGVMPLGNGVPRGGNIKVFDGPGCAGATNLLPAGQTKPKTLAAGGSRPSILTADLHIGHRYTLYTDDAFEKKHGVTVTASGIEHSLDAITGGVEFVALDIANKLEVRTSSGAPSIKLAFALKECVVDQVAQAPTDHLSVSWTKLTRANEKLAHVQSYQHAIDVKKADGTWTEVRSYETATKDTHSTRHLALAPGGTYRSRVRACHPAGCYAEATSTGVVISEATPVAGKVQATYTQPLSHDGSTKLLINWQAFTAVGLGEIKPALYQWAVASDNSVSDLVTPWHNVYCVDKASCDGKKTPGIHYQWSNDWTFQVEKTLTDVDFSHYDVHGHLYVAVRAFGLSGSTGVSLVRVEATTLLKPEHRIAIYDLLERPLGPPPYKDIQYTNQRTRQAAAWPTLWNEQKPDFWEWSLSDTREFKVCEKKGNQTSNYCGKSTDRKASSFNIGLRHNNRYYWCVRAGPTTVAGSLRPSNGDTSCSNGFTVDMSPPTGGTVVLGYPSSHALAIEHGSTANSAVYQLSSSELVARWSGFIDVEESGSAPHASGIAAYTLSIGSGPGAADVWGPKDVGASQHQVVRNLSLSSGVTYYATVVAADYTGATKSVGSRGVTVDQTAPTATAITVKQTALKSGAARLAISWDESADAESGVVEYLVGVGNGVGSGDVVGFKSLGDRLQAVVDLPVSVPEGHPVTVTVKSINGVGLVRNSGSSAIPVDARGPTAGLVKTISPSLASKAGACGDSNQCEDLRFQTETHTLALSWSGFSDVVGIQEYSWALGTAPGAADVHDFHTVLAGASATAVYVDRAVNLELQDGIAYYATVKACDLQQRCVTKSSTAVVVDASAPAPGHVRDGFHGEDADFQVDLSVVGATWLGFHDPHSHIARYEWCAGTAAGKCDLTDLATTGIRTSAITATMKKSVGATTVFITVTAYNNAGLSTTVSSDGVRVDSPKGTISAQLEPVHKTPGANNAKAQPSRSVLKASWTYGGFGPGPVAVWYTISSHSGGDPPVPAPVRVYGKSDTIAGLKLQDGVKYYVEATACDTAGWCARHSIDQDGMLIDGSPPMTHGWGKADNWVWTANNALLAWEACVDPHSDIASYTLSIGSQFGSADVAFQKGITAEQLRINLLSPGKISQNKIYYATLTCINSAGLAATPIHVQMKAKSGGVLERYEHSCQIVGCGEDRQCTCGATVESCAGPLPKCTQDRVNTVPTTLPIMDGFAGPDGVQQHDTSALMARLNWGGAKWTAAQKRAVRLQYSVVDQATQVRASAFQNAANGRDWIDVPPMSDNVVFTVPEGQRLTPGLTYAFVLRVWVTHTSFTTFVSNGITITPIGPQLSRRERLVETSANAKQLDTDHTTNVNSVTVSWKGRKSPVFFEAVNKHGAAIAKYEVCMGTRPGATDIADYRTLTTAEVNAKAATVSKLNLAQGQHYWVSVRATDTAGLWKVASTDGLRIDTTPPDATGAMLMDGHITRDLDFQAETTGISGSWHGFSDAESGIRNYMVGFVYVATGALKPGTLPASWKDNGLANSVSDLTGAKGALKAGRYYLFVKAVNGVGKESAVKVSDGITVDTSAPVPVQCSGNAAANLVKNGGVETKTVWAFAKAAGVKEASASLPEAGSSISQQITTKKGALYRLKFSARVDTSTEDVTGASSGLVSVAADTFPFVVRQANADPLSQWQPFEFQFVADSTTTEVYFAASKHANYMPDLLLDDVSVSVCSQTTTSAFAVHPGPAFQSTLDTITAQWSITDTESGVADSMWAIGTVAGGEQLYPYTSVGRRTRGSVSGLRLVHGERVFVSVVATNGAGKRTKLSSTPVLIDHTPPVVGKVLTGGAYQFQADTVSVQFAANDAESDIASCEVAVGHSPDNHDIVKFAAVADGIKKPVLVKLPAKSVADKDTIYVTVRCTNNAGLHAEATSSSLLVLSKPPSSKGVVLSVLAASQETVYAAEVGVQAATDSLHLAWEGYGNDGAALRFQLQVRGEGYKPKWVDAGKRHSVKLDKLGLAQGKEYTVALRAIDDANRASAETTTKVLIDASAPAIVKTGKFCGTKNSAGDITLTWIDTFSDDVAGMRYELSVGTTSGAGSLVFRKDVKTNTYSFKTPAGARLSELYIVVTAINRAGLATTMRSTVALKPAGDSTASC